MPPVETIEGYSRPRAEQKWVKPELLSLLPEDILVVSGIDFPVDYRLSWEEARREEIIVQTGRDPEMDPDGEKSITYRAHNPFYINPHLESFRIREWERINNGFWFMNDGVPTYITGTHYFFLVYWCMDTGYAQYRETDRDLFYFWEVVKLSDCFYGLIEVTKRGQGKSYRAGCIMYLECISRFSARCGIQSKSDNDASDFFLNKVVEPYKTLPDFLVPIHNHSPEPKSKLSFFPRRNNRASKKSALRSSIDFRSSGLLAYDSATLRILVQDECGKTDSSIVDVQQRLAKNIECVFRDSKMLGKIYCTTTIEGMKEGGEQCYAIWRNSNHNNPNALGQTPSGLARFFTSALDCTFFDEYGRPDRVKAKIYHDIQRASRLHDSILWTNYVQKNPYNIDEAFMIQTDDCVFNLRILNERRRFLDEVCCHKVGRLEWIDKATKVAVKFVLDPEGHWHLSYFPQGGERNNIMFTGKGSDILTGERIMRSPLNRKFVCSYDPFSHGNTAFKDRRSDAGIVVRSKSDFFSDPEYSNTYVADYVFRPQKPSEAHEEVFKACVFFGCQFLCENQKNGIFEMADRMGFSDFVMWRPEITINQNSSRVSAVTEGAPATSMFINQSTELLQEDVIDNGWKLKHPRIVDNLIRYKPELRTKFDLVVCCQLGVVAATKRYDRNPDEDDYESDDESYELSGNGIA